MNQGTVGKDLNNYFHSIGDSLFRSQIVAGELLKLSLNPEDMALLLSGQTELLDGEYSSETIMVFDLLANTIDKINNFVNSIIDADAETKAKVTGKIIGFIAYAAVEGAAISATVVGSAAVLKRVFGSLKTFVKAIKATGTAGDELVEAFTLLEKRIALTARQCFAAGTKIATPEGLKNIEDIRVGELVLTRSDKLGHDDWKTEYKPVVNTFVTHPSELYHVTIMADSGQEETFKVTGTHPLFHLDRKEFVPVEDLMVDDWIAISNGGTAVIRSIERERAEHGNTYTTYNFEVADTHTYFAGEIGIWAHNLGDLCSQPFEGDLL